MPRMAEAKDTYSISVTRHEDVSLTDKLLVSSSHLELQHSPQIEVTFKVKRLQYNHFFFIFNLHRKAFQVPSFKLQQSLQILNSRFFA